MSKIPIVFHVLTCTSFSFTVSEGGPNLDHLYITSREGPPSEILVNSLWLCRIPGMPIIDIETSSTLQPRSSRTNMTVKMHLRLIYFFLFHLIGLKGFHPCVPVRVPLKKKLRCEKSVLEGVLTTKEQREVPLALNTNLTWTDG